MKKTNLRKHTKMITSLALVAMIGLSMTNTAFAKDWAPDEEPAAAISKVLETGKGVELPGAMNFTFNIKPISLNDDTTLADTMPALTGGSITIDAADKVAMTTESFDKDVYAEDGGNFLKAFEVNQETTVTGVYKYEITENANTVTVGDSTKESVTYDSTKYAFRVYVNEDENGKKYISGTSTVIIKNNGEEGTDKVNPTPGSTDIIEGSTETYSGMKFVNGYSVDKGSVDTDPSNPVDPDPTDPETYGLKVSKTVTGKDEDTTKFPFTFNVTKPTAVGHEDTEFTYYVFDGTTPGTAKTGTYGSDIEEELQHGQSIVVKNAYAGSKVAVIETGTENYIPSASVTLNGIETKIAAPLSKELSIGENKIMGKGSNTIDYTNKFQDMTPTGIVMNNLPFFMLILVAFFGIGSFAVINSRKRRG